MLFRSKYLESSSASIGLVPLAVGGSPLSEWEPTGSFYAKTIAACEEIQKSHRIVGVLWHQGENDAIEEHLALSYSSRLTDTIACLRAQLNLPDLPFVIGELGYFLADIEDRIPYHEEVNRQLHIVANSVKNVQIVSAAGLSHIGDHLHFDTDSLRKLGERYAANVLNWHYKVPPDTLQGTILFHGLYGSIG